MQGFSKILSLVFVLFALSIGVGVFWFYEANKPSFKPVENKILSTSPDASVGTPTLPSADVGAKEKNMITLSTNFGDITFETYNADAQKTVENFVALAKKGFYNGVIFHRVIKGFMIQGGDPTGTGRGGPGYTFADELNSQSASYRAGYKKGVVAMANAGPNTNGSQFFIMLADYPLPNSYTIFGKVTSGQDIVDKIGLLKTDSNDKPLTDAVIKSVRVEDK
ncbi:MAG: peptidylprolyl isomerase [bacterium]|nr:peptidylprolyl isomerase [bacterium]